MPASETLVEQVMQRKIYTAKENTPMGKVLTEMAEKGIGSAIIVNEYGHLSGLVDGSRIVDAIAHDIEERLKDVAVEKLMKKQFPRVSPKNTLLDVAELMDNYGVHYLVVVDGLHPVGVISQGDIARWWVQQYSGFT